MVERLLCELRIPWIADQVSCNEYNVGMGSFVVVVIIGLLLVCLSSYPMF